MEPTKQSTKAAERLLWITSDNQAFFEEVNALNHSRKLHDPTIVTKTSDEAERELEELYGDDTEDEE